MTVTATEARRWTAIARDGELVLVARRPSDSNSPASIFNTLTGKLAKEQALQVWFKWGTFEAIDHKPLTDLMTEVASDELPEWFGGPGSGHWGHKGIKGQRGGSAAGSGGIALAGAYPASTYPKGPDTTGEAMTRYFGEGIEDPNYFWATDSERAAIKKKICEDVAKTSDLIDTEDVNDALAQWSATSNDHNPDALEMQASAAKVMGVELSPWQKQKRQETQADYGDRYKPRLSPEKREAIIKGMYENTQRELAREGFGPNDKIRLRRGVRLPADAATSGEYELARGVAFEGSVMESWAVSPVIASGFSEGVRGKTGVVLEMDVPRRNILSTGRTGFGCVIEGEVVVLGSIPNQRAKIIAMSQPSKVSYRGLSWAKGHNPYTDSSHQYAKMPWENSSEDYGSAMSGHWGHKGIKGQRGGSAPGGAGLSLSGGTAPTTKREDLDLNMQKLAVLNDDLPSARKHQYATNVDRREVKYQIAQGLADETGIDQTDVNDIMGRWTITAGDENEYALQFQRDAASEFGLKTGAYVDQKMADVETGFHWVETKYQHGRLDSDGNRKFQKAVYDRTQARLKEKGFKPGDKVRLQRGVALPLDDTKDWEVGSVVKVDTMPLSSWSATPGTDVEGAFARGGGSPRTPGYILESEIPIESIWSTARTGPGCLPEGEFIVLGTQHEAKVVRTYYK